MSRNFSLSSLTPEPDYFIDDAFGGDGTKYEISRMDQMPPAVLSTLRDLYDQSIALQQAPTDEPFKRGIELDAILGKFIQILVPALPDARVAALPVPTKINLIEWWQPAALGSVSAPPNDTKGGAT